MYLENLKNKPRSGSNFWVRPWAQSCL